MPERRDIFITTSITYVIFLLVLIIPVGCKDEVKPDILIAQSEMTKLSDSTLVGYIQDAIYTKGDWILCDNQALQVIVIRSESLEITNKIASAGDGPGEIRYCTALGSQGDSLYVYDAGNRRFSLFTRSGKFLRLFGSPRLGYSFAVDMNGNIGSSLFSGNPPLVELTGDGIVVRNFGSILRPTESDVQNRLKSVRHVALLPNGETVFVGKAVPVIEIYDNFDSLARSVDMSSMPMFSRAVSKSDNFWRDEGTDGVTVTIIEDVSIDANGYIYLLSWEGPGAYNRVLKILSESLKIEKYWQLLDSHSRELDWAQTLAVSSDGNSMIVFNNTLQRLLFYKL